MRRAIVSVMVAWPAVAFAEVDPACADLPKPANYDEQVQQDFQANYYALVSSFSPLHAAVPHDGGRGYVGVDVGLLPPLACEQRFVLEWQKTEDTNKSPILPKITAGYAFPTIKDIAVIYAGVGVLPPIPVGGTRNLVVSGELGFGVTAHEHVEAGLRGHATLQRTYGDVATAFDPETEPVVEDVYVGSTWGFDALVSFPVLVGEQRLDPYLAVGYLDASTFFFVGDSSVSIDNLHPYSGVAFALGLDSLFVNRFRLGVEFYGAPGGVSLPVADTPTVDDVTRYGRLYTARLRLGYEF